MDKSAVRARTFNMPSIQKYIAIAFEKQLEIFRQKEMQLKKGDAILAKMRGYDPWPARILDFTNNKKTIKCYFFGTHNTGSIGIRNAIPFADALETIRLICLRNSIGFVKGIMEIETEYGVPKDLSSLKECEAIQ